MIKRQTAYHHLDFLCTAPTAIAPCITTRLYDINPASNKMCDIPDPFIRFPFCYIAFWEVGFWKVQWSLSAFCNPLSGERRKTLSITPMPYHPQPTRYHLYIIHLINWLQRFYRIEMSLKRPFVQWSDVKQWFTTTILLLLLEEFEYLVIFRDDGWSSPSHCWGIVF